jgi:GTPase SAR1 family protein
LRPLSARLVDATLGNVQDDPVTSVPVEANDFARQQADAPEHVSGTIYDIVRDLRRDVEELRFPLPIDGASDADEARIALLSQLDEHLLPRLKELSSPAIVVIAGSTGAGKSTLFNSLLRGDISPAGVLRPTTREPVMAFNPADADVVANSPAKSASRVVFDNGVPRGLAVLDAPDLDSLVDENRATADKLLEAADLWLFVTTAARYGDALPWKALQRAAERGASVAMILNRVTEDNLATIRGDLLDRLREHGMADVPLFVVPDVGPHEGLLPDDTVEPVRKWLNVVAGLEQARMVIQRTLKGSLSALPRWVDELIDAVDAQILAADVLGETVQSLQPEVEESARAVVDAGTVAGTTFAARWADLNSRSHIDRVRVTSGRVKSTARAARKREEALVTLRADVEEAARRALVAIGTRAEERIHKVLSGEDAPAGAKAIDRVTSREAARVTEVNASVREWTSHADSAVRMLTYGQGPGADVEKKRVAAALKAFGNRGLGTVLLAAAAGSDDARLLLARVMGEAPDAPVAALREELSDRAAGVVEVELAAARRPLTNRNLEDSAATGLRVRLAEIRRLT